MNAQVHSSLVRGFTALDAPLGVSSGRPEKWLPNDELRRLRLSFLRKAKASRRYEPAMFGPLLRVASEYGAEMRARRMS